MNFSKLFFSVIFFFAVLISPLSTSFSETQVLNSSPATYYVDVKIDDVIWRYTYDDDGTLLSVQPIDID